ncbi:hypothetical protein G6F46_014313 [Rhizopus delemar]|nr:hypothetical protein G6F46_014313 [Rhizopus delemar]
MRAMLAEALGRTLPPGPRVIDAPTAGHAEAGMDLARGRRASQPADQRYTDPGGPGRGERSPAPARSLLR